LIRPKRAARKQKLTELSVRRLKPEPAAYLIWDIHQRGLAVRVQPTGARAWKCIYSRQGRPRWLHLGDAGGIGLADARTLAAEAMLAVARGKDPAAEKLAERGAGTFAELADRYVEHYAKRRNKSWEQADKLIRRHALPRWGNLRASSVGRADVRAMMSRIDAPVLANQVLAAVSAIFSWAVKQEVVGTNPCRGVDRNATRSRERVLSDSEIPRFWSAFDDAGLIISTALKTILLTGHRPGELGRTSGTCDPPVGGTVGFWKLLMPPLAKTCPKTVSAPERGGLSVEGDFAKKFFRYFDRIPDARLWHF
jgi:NAD(P)-dependent dehydrogenase (short-subunit alcohol dehydrogenase family)